MSQSASHYFVPQPSHWPIFGSIALLLMANGTVHVDESRARPGHGCCSSAGFFVLLVMLFGWFANVIRESEGGSYGKNVDVSFRWAMSWFIFSEVMFFAAFFGALFYIRVSVCPRFGRRFEWRISCYQWLYQCTGLRPAPGFKGDTSIAMGAWGLAGN